MTEPLRTDEPADLSAAELARIRAHAAQEALRHARTALAFAKIADAPNVIHRARLLIKSAEGAARHSDLRCTHFPKGA